MTKNTLKQLIRECIKESLNENKMDVIARKAARKNPDKNMGENKMDVIARKSARKNPDKNMGENKMDSLPAYVSRGETRQSRRDQVAIAKLFTELETSTFMKDPLLFMAKARGDTVNFGSAIPAVPVLTKDDDGYNHIEIHLGFKDTPNRQKGFLKVYGNPNSDNFRVIDSSTAPLIRDPDADYDPSANWRTEDEVLKIIRDKISNEMDIS